MGECDITSRVSKAGFSDTVTFGQTLEGNKGQSHENIWRNSITQKKIKYKGPEKGVYSVPQETRKEVSMAGAQ